MFMSHEQNAVQNHNVKVHSKFCELWWSSDIWKHLLTNQNWIHEEIKSRL